MEDREPVAGWPAAIARTAVGALLVVAALPPALLGVAMNSWTRERVTRFGYSTLEAASAPISGIGLLLVAAGLAFLALCVLGLRHASRRMGLAFLVAGAALFAGGARSAGIPTLRVTTSPAVGCRRWYSSHGEAADGRTR